MLATLIWDPSPYLFSFKIPLIERPILWYGFLFAIGFLVGYRALALLAKRYCSTTPLLLHPSFEDNSSKFIEKLSLFVILGGLIGARLGDLLFYQKFQAILDQPLMLISFWEGGLDSHGGAIGILIAFALFARKYHFPFFQLIDLVSIPITAAAVFIRIGNFFNQEILGTPTNLPWGILFLHPADGSFIVPRHPAQLYEAIAYLTITCLLIYKRELLKIPGKMAGLFILLVFSARFCIEFLKEEQSIYLSAMSILTMGQYLSIPFILMGLLLFLKRPKKLAA